MRFSKLFSLLFALILVSIVSACGSGDAKVYPITIDDVFARANQRRQDVQEHDMDRILAHIEGRTPSVIELEKLLFTPRASVISAYEAVEDVMILFDFLKHGYGAYEYFGGDAVFLPLRDRLIEDLADYEEIVTGILSQMIQGALSEVIADNHFEFDRTTIGISYNFFVWETPFVRSGNGVREKETDRYLLEVIGHDLDDILRLAANESGEFYYIAVIPRPEDYGLRYSIEAVFEGGTELIQLRNSSILPTPGRTMTPSLTFENDIPIVTMRGNLPFPVPTAWDLGSGFIPDNTNIFLSYADQLQGQPYVILDIRSNTGGSTLLPELWLYRLLGEVVPHNRDIIRQRPGSVEIDLPDDFAEFSLFWREYDRLMNQDEMPEVPWLEQTNIALNYYFELISSGDGFVPNDTILILLIDRFAFSAAELFVSHVLNIENTLIIGQNTSGGLLTPSGFPHNLPNSGLSFSFADEFYLYQEGQFGEGIGYAPDIWAVGDALTVALSLINNMRQE